MPAGHATPFGHLIDFKPDSLRRSPSMWGDREYKAPAVQALGYAPASGPAIIGGSGNGALDAGLVKQVYYRRSAATEGEHGLVVAPIAQSRDQRRTYVLPSSRCSQRASLGRSGRKSR